ncbi:MAG: SGNH/GDSL hydrolase family protein [Pirellulales bacterium]|nr:SGNH/GDSL hydrolase family protein [Pirellulales bacterium]
MIQLGANDLSVPPPTLRSNSRKRIAFRLCAIVTGVFVGVVLTEVFLRLTVLRSIVIERVLINTHPDSYPALWTLCLSENLEEACTPTPAITGPSDEWKLIRLAAPLTDSDQTCSLDKLSETPWSLAYPRFRGGVLHQEYDHRAPNGKHRILGVGDSFGLSWGVPRDRGLFGQLETILGKNCEVLNVSRPGLHTDEELACVKAALEVYQCPLTIVQWLPNDIHMAGPEPEQVTGRRMFPDPPRNWMDHSRIAMIYHAVCFQAESWNWQLKSYDPAYNPEGLRQFEESVKGFATLPNTRVVFVLYPRLEGRVGSYPYAKVHEQIAEMLHRHGIPVLDLRAAFEGHQPWSLRLHANDSHPNSAAHGIAARAIAAWLRREFPELVPP